MSYTDGHVKYGHGYGLALTMNFLVEEAGKNQAGELVGPFEWTSLAFSPTGHPAIAYYDTSNHTIKYAVGTVFITPRDHLSSLLSNLLFRVRSALRLGQTPSLR